MFQKKSDSTRYMILQELFFGFVMLIVFVWHFYYVQFVECAVVSMLTHELSVVWALYITKQWHYGQFAYLCSCIAPIRRDSGNCAVQCHSAVYHI